MEHTPPSNLVLIKGKWYVNVTVPLALRDTLGKQKRLSTGTSDKKIAKQTSARHCPEIVRYV